MSGAHNSRSTSSSSTLKPAKLSAHRAMSANPDRDATTVVAEDLQEKDDIWSHPGSQSEDYEDGDISHVSRSSPASEPYSAAEERTVLRKLDRRLTLFLCLLYLLSFLDRSNIGNARVAGMQSSLGITSSQFDLTLLTFYITYITFEWMILLYRLVPPHVYIACCVFAWGLVACLQSVVTSFSQLLTLRALLGVTEAAFGPGVPFYMTFFYRRDELAYRVGLQISAAPLATSFASSLAWLIVRLSEYSPLESWRALFLLEGFPSIVAAVFAFYLIPDSPARARWLTPRERKVAVARLQSADVVQADGSSRLNLRHVLGTLMDPKAWLPALMFLSVNVSFSSLPVFLPTIIRDMEFTPLTSQILAAPPYLFAFAFVLIVCRASDRIPDSRGRFLVASGGLSCASYSVIAIVGALSAKGIVGSTLSIVVRYIAVYGAAMGLFTSVVLIITWQLNNQASTTGKGVGMVILNIVGQTGPLIGVKLFPGGDEPYFVKGMAVSAGFMGLVTLLSFGLRLYLGSLNRRLSSDGTDRGQYEMVVMHQAADMQGDDKDESEGLVSGEGGSESWRGVRHQKEFRFML